MEFSDKIERQESDTTLVIRKYKEASMDGTVEVLRELPQTQRLCLCRTEIRHVKLNEAIHSEEKGYITYRIK